MIEINGKIKDIEGNIIEDDIPICIEEVVPFNRDRVYGYWSFSNPTTNNDLVNSNA
jgi:hypothetical protein